jgi:beta-glucosidase
MSQPKLLVRILAYVVPVLPALAEPPHRRADVAARVEAVLRNMTLEQKLGQLQQLGGDPKTGGLHAGQRERVRQGRIGSFLDVRGARNVNQVQRIAVEESPAKIPILFGFDLIHGYTYDLPSPSGRGE